MGIVGGLLIGWILGLFGFKGVVIAGMAQLFGVKLSALGYYFIFAMMGFISSVFRRKPFAEVKAEKDDAMQNLQKSIVELKKISKK